MPRMVHRVLNFRLNDGLSSVYLILSYPYARNSLGVSPFLALIMASWVVDATGYCCSSRLVGSTLPLMHGLARLRSSRIRVPASARSSKEADSSGHPRERRCSPPTRGDHRRQHPLSNGLEFRDDPSCATGDHFHPQWCLTSVTFTPDMSTCPHAFSVC